MPTVRRVVTSTAEPLYNEGDVLIKSANGLPTYGMTEADLASMQLAEQQQAQRAAEIVNAARNGNAVTYGGNQGTVPILSGEVRLANMAQGAPRRLHTYGTGYPGWSNWAGDNYRGEFVGFPDAVPHVLYGGMMDTLAPYMQSLAPFLAAAMSRRRAVPAESSSTTAPAKKTPTTPAKRTYTKEELDAMNARDAADRANEESLAKYKITPTPAATPVATPAVPVTVEPTFDMPMVEGFDNDADYVNGEYDVIETAPISAGDAASAFGKAAATAGSIWSLLSPRSLLNAGKWFWNLNRTPAAAANAGSKVFNPQGVQMSQSLINRMSPPPAAVVPAAPAASAAAPAAQSGAVVAQRLPSSLLDAMNEAFKNPDMLRFLFMRRP